MVDMKVEGDQGGRGSAPGNTQPSLEWYPTPVSGALNLGDRTKNAGGRGHRATGTLSGKVFAYQVVAMFVKVILFLHMNAKWPMDLGEMAKHQSLPRETQHKYLRRRHSPASSVTSLLLASLPV